MRASNEGFVFFNYVECTKTQIEASKIECLVYIEGLEIEGHKFGDLGRVASHFIAEPCEFFTVSRSLVQIFTLLYANMLCVDF